MAADVGSLVASLDRALMGLAATPDAAIEARLAVVMRPVLSMITDKGDATVRGKVRPRSRAPAPWGWLSAGAPPGTPATSPLLVLAPDAVPFAGHEGPFVD